MGISASTLVYGPTVAFLARSNRTSVHFFVIVCLGSLWVKRQWQGTWPPTDLVPGNRRNPYLNLEPPHIPRYTYRTLFHAGAIYIAEPPSKTSWYAILFFDTLQCWSFQATGSPSPARGPLCCYSCDPYFVSSAITKYGRNPNLSLCVKMAGVGPGSRL